MNTKIKKVFENVGDKAEETYIYCLLEELKDRFGVSKLNTLAKELKASYASCVVDWNAIEEAAWARYRQNWAWLLGEPDREKTLDLQYEILDYLINN